MSADWLQVIINSIIVLIYFFMLLSNNKMVVETKEMAMETKETRLQAYRPEVIAYIREEDEYLYFQIKNVGTRPAFNISLNIEKFFNNTVLEGNQRFFNQVSGTIRDVEKNILLLAPGQSIESYMGVREILSKGEGLSESPIKIEYFNREKYKYNEEYTLSLKDFIDINRPYKKGFHEIAEELSIIKSELLKYKK